MCVMTWLRCYYKYVPWGVEDNTYKLIVNCLKPNADVFPGVIHHSKGIHEHFQKTGMAWLFKMFSYNPIQNILEQYITEKVYKLSVTNINVCEILEN